MENILALSICLATVCAGFHIEDLTRPPPVAFPESDDANSTQGHCFDCDGLGRYYPPAVPSGTRKSLKIYIDEKDLAKVVSDHDAGRPLDFCVIVDLLLQNDYYNTEEDQIQEISLWWPEEEHAKAMSKIELLPKCPEEVFSSRDSICAWRECVLRRRMSISAIKSEYSGPLLVDSVNVPTPYYK